MSTAAAALVGAVGAGAGGLLVPWLASRLPPPYAEAAPALRRVVLVSALAGASVGAAIGLDWPLLPLVPLVPVGVLLALLDRATHLIPTVVVWPTLAGVALLAAVGAVAGSDTGDLVRGVEGALLTGALFYALWWLHPGGMGFGDVRLSTVVGLALGVLGWSELLVGVYAGFVLFSLVAIGRVVRHRDGSLLRRPSPYGPALLGGALVGVVLTPLASYLASG